MYKNKERNKTSAASSRELVKLTDEHVIRRAGGILFHTVAPPTHPNAKTHPRGLEKKPHQQFPPGTTFDHCLPRAPLKSCSLGDALLQSSTIYPCQTH